MRYRESAWTMALPLYEQVVFVDWHGVMSTDHFWQSYTPRAGDPGFAEVQLAVARLFSDDAVVLRWMKGQISSSEIVDRYLVDAHEDLTQGRQALKAALLEECEKVKTDRWMSACLQRIRSSKHVVLATDNMDCFVNGIQLRKDLASVFDDYISSSDVGVLKSEDPHRFFGLWMEERGVDPRGSVLIDDNEENCAVFERLGGRSILFKGNEGRVDVLELVWPSKVGR